jgi:hypothetical protein
VWHRSPAGRGQRVVASSVDGLPCRATTTAAAAASLSRRHGGGRNAARSLFHSWQCRFVGDALHRPEAGA